MSVRTLGSRPCGFIPVASVVGGACRISDILAVVCFRCRYRQYLGVVGFLSAGCEDGGCGADRRRVDMYRYAP